jgi:hypothetical protein
MSDSVHTTFLAAASLQLSQRHTRPVVRDTALLNRAGQTAMNVLLLSMPDYFEHIRPDAIRMLNGALTSLARTVDPHHRVAVAEMILSHR